MTTNEKLSSLGYTTTKVANRQKNIIKDGKIVFTGKADEVERFLTENHCCCGAWEGPENYPGAMWDSPEDWCPVH